MAKGETLTPPRNNLLFVTGTGTNVGKTVVTAGLAASLLRSGKRVGVAKPVQTGVEPGTVTDLDVIETVCRNLGLTPVVRRGPYSFKEPVSPHLAARLEGRRIELLEIIRFIEDFRAADIDALIIEGVGGACVPLDDEGTLVTDLIQVLAAPALVVAGVQLGTINHSLLTIKALREAGIEVAGVVFNQLSPKPAVMGRDSIDTIRRLGKIDVLAEVPQIKSPTDSREFAEELNSYMYPQKIL